MTVRDVAAAEWTVGWRVWMDITEVPMRKMLVAALALLPTLAHAAAFYPPMPGVAPNKPSYVVLNDGTRLDGEVKTAVVGPGGDVRKLVLQTADGEKHKLKAAQVKELGNQPGDFMKMAARSSASDSIAAHNTYDGRAMPEWVTWHAVAHPKNGKVILLQELNPDFDSRLQVYADPRAQETGGVGVGDIQMTGGVEKSFVVTKDGSAPMIVKKGDYDQQFGELFGDCSAFAKPEKLDWKDFGDHVKAYSEACPTK
jgi:hypothetical protein